MTASDAPRKRSSGGSSDDALIRFDLAREASVGLVSEAITPRTGDAADQRRRGAHPKDRKRNSDIREPTAIRNRFDHRSGTMNGDELVTGG
jgi:hypothetical protein